MQKIKRGLPLWIHGKRESGDSQAFWKGESDEPSAPSRCVKLRTSHGQNVRYRVGETDRQFKISCWQFRDNPVRGRRGRGKDFWDASWDVLSGNVRLPDERSRLGESGRRAAFAGVPASGIAGIGFAHPLQHMQHPGKSGAEGVLAAGGIPWEAE